MTQGKASQEEAQASIEAMNEIMEAFPKSKVPQFFGHFNDVMLFLGACKRTLPSEEK